MLIVSKHNTTDQPNKNMTKDDSKIDEKAKYSAIDDFLKQYVTPQWFVLLIALIYVSGFLCESIFYNSFGIHEMGGEFLRASYIYAGILFLFFPLSILIPILFSMTLKRVETVQKMEKIESAKEPFYFPYSTWITLLNLNLIFYLTIFTPHNFDTGRWQRMVAYAVFVSLCGPVIVDFLISNTFWKKLLRWSIAAFVVIYFDKTMYFQFHHHLKMIFWPPGGALLYFFFMFMIFYITWRCKDHLSQIETEEGKSAMKLLGISLSLMFCFLGIAAFALEVYPYIPVAKGGGYYLESPRVQLVFRNEIPINVGTNNFIIIEQTDSSLFLAKITNNTDPNVWIEQRKFPSVVEISRDEIAQITYTQYTATNYYPNP